MPDAPTNEQLVELVAQLSRRNAELERLAAEQADEIAALRRRAGRNPGKQLGAPSRSRSLVDDPNET